jgi:hypothetical protein
MYSGPGGSWEMYKIWKRYRACIADTVVLMIEYMSEYVCLQYFRQSFAIGSFVQKTLVSLIAHCAIQR